MCSSHYELTDDLARLCLPSAHRDPNRKLAWLNSICILFLVIGAFGVKPATISLPPLPPLEDIAPVILEPAPAPPETITANQLKDESEPPAPDAPRVVVVVPNAPNITFSVPTIGTLVAPEALAQAPPLNPMQRVAPASQLAQLSNTGSGGDRPQPPYPKIALDQGEQGTVTLLMTADAAGNVASVQVKGSSGFPVLDRATLDFIQRHWTLPVGGSSNQLFEASITYKLQTD
jgi:periplasmic protein TonB